MLNFDQKTLFIGCVHVLPLPGAPGYSGNIENIIDIAVIEAEIYVKAGFDALILENMHDLPYLKRRVYPETVAAMTAIACAVRKVLPQFPIGIQILSAANREALGVAISAKLDFLRVEGYTFAHVADEGIIESCAADLIRVRDYLKANNVSVFADIKKKHSSHAITSDVSIEETAETAEFMKADGVVITGTATGKEPLIGDIHAVRSACKLPLLIGSGVTPQNINKYYEHVDGLIIGSYCKEAGKWQNTVSYDRCRELVEAIKK